MRPSSWPTGGSTCGRMGIPSTWTTWLSPRTRSTRLSAPARSLPVVVTTTGNERAGAERRVDLVRGESHVVQVLGMPMRPHVEPPVGHELGRIHADLAARLVGQAREPGDGAPEAGHM